MTKGAVRFNRFFLIAGIITLLYYLGMGITVRFGQSLLYLWLMLSVVCFARYFLWKQAWKKGKAAPLPRTILRILNVLIAAGLTVFFAVECFVVSGAFHTPQDGLDAITVLGARVNDDGPSGSLRERIETAADYLKRNPNTVCIVSGGQGDDEPMSEAQCMLEGLVSAGVESERILMEDQSTSTVENLRNSLPMLDENVHTVGIVTSDFHVFRALCLARSIGGYDFSGIPARSSFFGFIHYAMREFFTLSVSLVRGYI